MEYAVEKKVDSLGRIVLPKSMREYYGIVLGDKIKLVPIENGILIVNASADK